MKLWHLLVHRLKEPSQHHLASNYVHTMRLCMSTYVHHGTMSISVDSVSQYLSIIQYPHQPISCNRAHACVQLSKSFAILPKLTTSGTSSFRKDVASCQEPGSTVNKGTGINDWNPTRNLKVLLDKKIQKFVLHCFAMFCKRKSVPHSWHSFKLGTKCGEQRDLLEKKRPRCLDGCSDSASHWGQRRGCDHRAEGDHTLLPTQDPQSLGRSAPFCSILAPFRDSLFEKYRHLSAYLGICDGWQVRQPKMKKPVEDQIVSNHHNF